MLLGNDLDKEDRFGSMISEYVQRKPTDQENENEKEKENVTRSSINL
jgi:hypothetical protein